MANAVRLKVVYDATKEGAEDMTPQIISDAPHLVLLVLSQP
jgi:hypothetical protein